MSEITKGWARLSRKTNAVVVSAAVTVAVGMTLPAPAQAYVGTGNLKNYATGRCLDSDFNGNVYTLPCSPPYFNLHQLWEPILQYRGDGIAGSPHRFDLVVLKNRATNRCLARMDNGALRTTVECDDNEWNSAREWYAQGSSWNKVIFSLWWGNTSYAVDSNHAGQSYAQTWNGGQHQQWNFIA
ncbi:RICIN domain-containing protein [Herbidospora sp. RD11066]